MFNRLSLAASLAALLFASSPSASAGIFGSKSDVAVKVAELPNPDGGLYPLGLDFSPDGKSIAVGSAITEKINIWDWRNRRIERTVEKPHGGNSLGTTNPIRFNPDGRFLAACEVSGTGNVVVRIWNTDTWSIAKDIGPGTGIESGGSCTGIGFTPDGMQFLRTAESGRATVPENARDLNASLDLLKRDPTIYLINLRQRKIQSLIPSSSSRGTVAWSSDGARLAIVGGPYVEIFDALTGQNLVRERIENSGHMNARFTADGRFYIDSDLNGMGKGLGVKIWDSQHQKLLQHIPAGDVRSIAVSNDGRYLAVGGTGHTAIWQFH
jgi:WD40 repeat protein